MTILKARKDRMAFAGAALAPGGLEDKGTSPTFNVT